MIDQEKLKRELTSFVEKHGNSVSAASKKLKSVSENVIRFVLTDNISNRVSKDKLEDLIAEVMEYNYPWKYAETFNMKKITMLLRDTQNYHQTCAIIGQGGIGKSQAFEQYVRKHKNVIWLRCESDWTKKHMLEQIIKGLGYNSYSSSILELRRNVSRRIKEVYTPLLIFDQYNKMTVSCKEMLIPVYNDVENNAGILISGTHHMKKDIERGVRLERDGYQEMYSRMQRKFIEIDTPSKQDVKAICYANRIEDDAIIQHIWEDCDGDLRRVRRKVHIEKMKKIRKAA